jgi:putative endonuclease
MPTRRQVAALGEKAAAKYLKGLGFAIRETNCHCPQGEIDIIAEHDAYLASVEVYTRRSSTLGTPKESITAARKAKVIDLAHAHIQTHNDLHRPWHIDLTAVELIENAANWPPLPAPLNMLQFRKTRGDVLCPSTNTAVTAASVG